MDSVWSGLLHISEILPTDSSCTFENSSEGKDVKSLNIYMINTACALKLISLLPSAALAADDATRGSTTDARKATVLMTGFSDWLKGTGWYASGPREAVESSR